MNDSKEIGLMYEAIAKSTYIINVNTGSSEQDRVSAILKKVNTLICNKERFNDTTDLVALNNIKSFIENL
tara:strand:- start:494 stop:703 length:210 start_codon:yes stop_codon:yes gene_type:complete